MTAAVPELRFLVPPAACVLRPHRVDAGLGEDALEPGQHQLPAEPLPGDEDEAGEADHVLEGVVLVLPGLEVLEHLGVGQCRGRHRGLLGLCRAWLSGQHSSSEIREHLI